MFSKACEYGIRAVIFISKRSLNEERTSLKEISREIDSPEAFTAKILQTLVKTKVVRSVKGPSGGFEITLKDMKRLKLYDVIHSIDGDEYEKKCVLGLKKCSEDKPCPVHNNYKHIKKQIITMVNATNLYDLSNSVEEGKTCLRL